MAVTIIIIVILAIIIIAVAANYRKKLSQGCCGAGGDTVEKVKTGNKDASEYPYQYTLSIEGMTCKNCAARIENKFNQTEDYFATVNLRKNSALVRTKTEVEDGELKSIVAKAGYHVTEIKQG